MDDPQNLNTLNSNAKIFNNENSQDFVEVFTSRDVDRSSVICDFVPNFWEWCWDQMQNCKWEH